MEAVVQPCQQESHAVSRPGSAPARPEAKSRPAPSWHHLLWGVLFAGLLLSVLPEFRRQLTIKTPPLLPADPLRSMNYFLRGTHVNDKLVTGLAALPEDGRVLILAQGDPISIFDGVAIGYLVWPHRIEMIFVDDQAADRRLRNDNLADFAGVIFCRVTPPAWFGPAIECGPNIQVVTGGKGKSKP